MNSFYLSLYCGMCLFDPPDSTYSLLIALWCVSLVRECFAVDIWFSVEIC